MWIHIILEKTSPYIYIYIYIYIYTHINAVPSVCEYIQFWKRPLHVLYILIHICNIPTCKCFPQCVWLLIRVNAAGVPMAPHSPLYLRLYEAHLMAVHGDAGRAIALRLPGWWMPAGGVATHCQLIRHFARQTCRSDVDERPAPST